VLYVTLYHFVQVLLCERETFLQLCSSHAKMTLFTMSLSLPFANSMIFIDGNGLRNSYLCGNVLNHVLYSMQFYDHPSSQSVTVSFNTKFSFGGFSIFFSKMLKCSISVCLKLASLSEYGCVHCHSHWTIFPCLPYSGNP